MIDTGTPYRCYIDINRMMKRGAEILVEAAKLYCSCPNCLELVFKDGLFEECYYTAVRFGMINE